MSKFIINGQEKLGGEINVNGAKNAALKIIPASLLSSQTIHIKNLPRIEDIFLSLELISDLGAKLDLNGDELSIDSSGLNKFEIKESFANKFRGSIMFVGPLLARFGEVKFPHPGGCVIGASGRPIDIFLEGYRSFGAEVKEELGYYHIKAKKLKASEYFFPLVSVTATESMMMTASLIPGTTVLKNCAMEPEIPTLAKYLNATGAKISGAGSPTITIEGQKSLKAGEITVMPDRLEAGSFAILAAAAKADLMIKNCEPEHIMSLIKLLEKIGVELSYGKDYLHIKKRNHDILAQGIKTHEYPGFSTDLQSPYLVLMTQAKGSSLIHETIYDRRLIWTDMLSQMGANITLCDPHRVIVQGPTQLYGKKLISPDLRAGIALIIAGLIAKGQTQIDNIYQIDRGYEKLEERLLGIGADIARIE